MTFEIDHVTFAGTYLESLINAFSEVGLTPDYGGPHSNGISHMSALAFTDGSYIELISTLEVGTSPPSWSEFIRTDAGACAWAVAAEDIHAEAKRLRAQGMPVDGPHYVSRQRPDGLLAEWDLAYVGDEGPGAVHPFLIQDRTARDVRVPQSVSVKDSELTGVAMVVIAVRDLQVSEALFVSKYGLEPAQVCASDVLKAPLRVFPDAPLALIAPAQANDWVDYRLSTLGPSPCAFLLSSDDLPRSRQAFSLQSDTEWQEGEAAWFTTPALRRLRLGVIRR